MRWLDETADDWPASMEQAYDLPDYPIDMDGPGAYVDLYSQDIWCGRLVLSVPEDGSAPGVDVLPPLAGDMTEYTSIALNLRLWHAQGMIATDATMRAMQGYTRGEVYAVPVLKWIDPVRLIPK